MSKEAIMVTGGCGFIGSHVVDSLLSLGHKVIIVDDLSRGNILNEKADFYKIDIADYDALAKIFEKEKPRRIVHLAAKARIQPSFDDPLEYHNSNVTGFFNVLELSRLHQVDRVVYASSSSILFGSSKVEQNEGDEPKPTSPYSATKYIDEIYAELYAETFGLSLAGLRFFNVYGTRMTKGTYKTVITTFMEQLVSGEPFSIVGDGNQKRDFTNIQDVSRAILLVLFSEKGSGEIFNVGTSKMYSINELAELIGGKDYPKEYNYKRRGEPAQTKANNNKIKETFGWTPRVELKDGLLPILKEWGVETEQLGREPEIIDKTAQLL